VSVWIVFFFFFFTFLDIQHVLCAKVIGVNLAIEYYQLKDFKKLWLELTFLYFVELFVRIILFFGICVIIDFRVTHFFRRVIVVY